MVKEVFFFNELAYSSFPQDVARSLGYTVLSLPNSHFEPNKAHDFYHQYLEEHLHALEAGFDGIMLSEHHNSPHSMSPSSNLIASILAKITKRGKIVLLGNILPVTDNPLRLAEEIAMLDVISGGRIVAGFVRGGGVESLATNANPVHNRERYIEGHDLIIKAWTTPGPFRWEGKHFHYRVVNPWVLPMQKPHPPIWVPGVASPETIQWAAKHQYPYIALNTSLESTPSMWKLYNDAAAEEGYKTTQDNFGYLLKICVADTDEKAYEEGKNFYWQLGKTFGLIPRHWYRPPGHVARAAAASQPAIIRDTYGEVEYEQAQQIGQIITGSPDTVIKKLKHLVDVVDPALLILWAREGPMSHESAKRCLELLGQEVIPAIKEYRPSTVG